MSQSNGMTEHNVGKLEERESGQGSSRSEAFSWLQSAEKKHSGAPMFGGFFSKPNAHPTTASPNSSPASAPGSSTASPLFTQGAKNDPSAFKRASSVTTAPLASHAQLSRASRVPQVERPPPSGQAEPVYADNDNSPAQADPDVENGYGSTPASPSNGRMWMPPTKPQSHGNLALALTLILTLNLTNAKLGAPSLS